MVKVTGLWRQYLKLTLGHVRFLGRSWSFLEGILSSITHHRYLILCQAIRQSVLPRSRRKGPTAVVPDSWDADDEDDAPTPAGAYVEDSRRVWESA